MGTRAYQSHSSHCIDHTVFDCIAGGIEGTRFSLFVTKSHTPIHPTTLIRERWCKYRVASNHISLVRSLLGFLALPLLFIHRIAFAPLSEPLSSFVDYCLLPSFRFSHPCRRRSRERPPTCCVHDHTRLILLIPSTTATVSSSPTERV